MAAIADSSPRPRLTTTLAIRGALAIVLGLAKVPLSVLGLLLPRVTTDVLILLFGGYVLLDGLTTGIAAVRASAAYARWLGVQGIVGLCAGIWIMSHWTSVDKLLFYLIVVWAVVTGVVDLVVGSHIGPRASSLMRIAGGASILLGIVVLAAWPGGGLLPFVWLIAAYALLVGILRVAAAFRS